MTYEELAGRPVLDLIPQALPMALLDRTVSISGEAYESEVTIRADSLFSDGEKVPAWIGVEYMAQSIAAFAGASALKEGGRVKAGFLLGTREYHVKTPYFKVGMRLLIHVKKVVHEPSGLSVVECRLTASGDSEPLVVSMLNVFEVADLNRHLKDHAS
jgi:predicted hotdog family 3-hydroxylacyl-ACP dehydratase